MVAPPQIAGATAVGSASCGECHKEIARDFKTAGHARPIAKGECPDDGFTLFVHPPFMTQLDRVPHLVLDQLVLVNYGDFASAEDAETFGASALGLSKEAYYQCVCELADEIAAALGI